MLARLSLLAGLLALGAPASGVVVEKAYVGTFSNPLTSFADLPNGDPDPATNPGLVSRGGKYVVKVSFDTDDLALVQAADRTFNSQDMWVVPLSDDPAAGGATNTYELFIPSEGFSGILTQTGPDHFFIGPGFAPTAEIQFFASCIDEATCDAAFRGFEFESNFIRANSATTPAPGGDVVFEQATADANFSDGPVTNYIVNVLDGNLQGLELNGGHVDVRSQSGSASGGQLVPGVFFAEAVPVVAEAGASPLVYSAGALVVTTDAGTETVTELPAPIVPGLLRLAPSAIDDPMRQADNDLGAARGDGEDFLTYSWTVDGVVLPGSESGDRLDRRVETLNVPDPATQPHGSRFVLDGTRSVDDVNVSVAIQDSGLTNTLDTITFSVQVDEAITGLGDSDTVEVQYANAAPVIDVALATPVAGDGLLFELAFSDADLSVNALGLADFELLGVTLLLDGNPFAGLSGLLATGSETVDQATLLALFGAGPHGLEVRLADRTLASTNDFVSAIIAFTVVPEPGAMALLLAPLAVLSLCRRAPSPGTSSPETVALEARREVAPTGR